MTLSAAATAATTVALSDNNAYLTVPASVTVSSGSATETFTATASAVTAAQSATVTATLNSNAVTAALTISAPAASTAPSLLAAYSFDAGTGSTVADSSANGNNGTIVGAFWVAGKVGNGLWFDGNTTNVDLGSPASLRNTGSMTWSAWVYATGHPYDDGQIVALSTDYAGWQFKTSPDTGSRTFGVAVSGSGTGHTQRYSKTVVATNTWYYVAGVYNATAKTLDIYVNGVLDNGTLLGTVPSSIYLPNVNVLVGERVGGYTFEGVIDELRIYNRALSAAEIQTNMGSAVAASSVHSATGKAAVASTEKYSTLSATQAVSKSSAALGLSCSQGVVNAGGTVDCEVRLPSAAAPLEVQLSSDSADLRVPATVTSRANQSRVTFQAFAERLARQSSVTVTAVAGGATVQNTVVVVPSAAPVLSVPSKQVSRIGRPVSFAVGGTDPSSLPFQITAADLPAGAAFSKGRFVWAPKAAQAGEHKVVFTATNSAGQSASASVVIEVSSGAPMLSTAAATVCSPGAIATVQGTWLAEPGTSLSDVAGDSMELAGTSVAVNGRNVPVLHVSADSVRFVCPAAEPGSPLAISVSRNGAVSNTLAAEMRQASPEILSLDESGTGQGMISFAGAEELVLARNFASPARPGQSGDQVIIWATGLGANAESAAQSVTVKLGGVPAEVESIQAVAGHAGVYGIQVRTPAGVTGDAVPVQLEVASPDGKLLESNRVTAAFEAE